MQSIERPAAMTLPFAANGVRNEIPVASQISVKKGAASFNDGFPPATMTLPAAGGIPPFGRDVNGVFFAVTSALRWMQAGGQPAYDADFVNDQNVAGYPCGAVLQSVDKLGWWVNTADDNPTDPDASDGSAAGWIPAYSYGGLQRGGSTGVVVGRDPLQAAKPHLFLGGSLTGDLTLVFPAWFRNWKISNRTTGNFLVNCTTADGQGVKIAPGEVANIYCDGVDICSDAPDSSQIPFQQSGDGAVQRTVENKAREWVTPEDFGAKGDGVTLDDEAIAKTIAAAGGRSIKTRDDAIYLMSRTVTVSGGRFALRGTGTFKLANGVIQNTDSDATNFTPLFRLQGMSWVDLGECTFDHNRDGQTYPSALSIVGRGTNPYRHNGSVEICPDATGTYPSTNVYVTKAKFVNSYLNGLVLWQVTNSVINECQMRNTTWDGIKGAGLRNVRFVRNHGYRCGVSTAWPTERNNGDRAAIQVREFSKNFTTASEGIPCITTGEFASGGINVGVDFTGNSGEECNVETIFGRAIRNLSGRGNRSLNCGFGRHAGAAFYPGHFWFEFCEGSFSNNEVWQTVVQPGDMQPDGYVTYAMIGDATSLFPFVGNYNIDARGNRAFSAKDASGNPQSGLLYRGIRSTGNVNTDGAYIDGTDDDGIFVTNTDVFQTTVLNASNFSSNGSTIINTNRVSGEGPIGVSRYGAGTTGTPSNIFALNCRVDAGKPAIVFNANLTSFGASNVTYSSGYGSVTSDADQVSYSVDAALWRRVVNPHVSANNIAGFQAQSNAGNTISAGVTSSTYSGSFGVASSAFVHASGANAGGLFVTATGGPVVLRPGGLRTMTLFSSGRVRIGSGAADDGINALQLDGTIGLRSYTVATLPTIPSGNALAFASNGRKKGEALSAGTGVPVYYSAGQWRIMGDDTEVQA